VSGPVGIVGDDGLGPKKPAPALVTDFLRSSAANTDQVLAPIERRLAELAKPFFSDLLLFCRIDPGGAGLRPISDEAVRVAARFSLVAAIEIEQPLRELRDKLGKG
jgi:hypothetical protein